MLKKSKSGLDVERLLRNRPQAVPPPSSQTTGRPDLHIMNFSGLRVVALESRRAQELTTLVEKREGRIFNAPSVVERPLEECREAFQFAEGLFRGEFDMVIFTTGTGCRYLANAIATRYPGEAFAKALRETTVVSRGPKPVAVLREMGVPVTVFVPEPNTWKEILEATRNYPAQRVAVQEYGRTNEDLIGALRNRGAEVTQVPVYRWELPADVGPIREAARRIAAHECEVVLFTTSVQLHHLMEVAEPMGLKNSVLAALGHDIVVASVGPIMNAALADYGLAPDIVPTHPKLGILVKEAAEQAHEKLAAKRVHRSATGAP